MGNTNTPMSLNHCFQYYEDSFNPAVDKASKDFSGIDFNVSLVSASYEPAFFWRDNDYFVTQVHFTSEFFLVLKISNIAADLILMETLGKRHRETEYLKLKNITELEARILTGYNELIYKHISELFLNKKEINSILHTLKNEKTVYLTFYVGGSDEHEAGRIIISFPEFAIRKIKPVSLPQELLDYEFFKKSIIETDILIGKTRVSLDEVQSLELEDIIILEDSNLYRMYLKEYQDVNINLNPSHSLLIDFEEEENGDDDTVSEVRDRNINIWDSLEVDVHASFEKVKMKLGELREITEGLVVDVASIADNKVFIEVENRRLAVGELVIIGDKYGVRITEICKEAKSREVEKLEVEAIEKQEELSEKSHYEENQTDDDDEDMEISEDIEDSDFEIDEDNEEEEEY